jgi:hypothetical protein
MVERFSAAFLHGKTISGKAIERLETIAFALLLCRKLCRLPVKIAQRIATMLPPLEILFGE